MVVFKKSIISANLRSQKKETHSLNDSDLALTGFSIFLLRSLMLIRCVSYIEKQWN